MIQTIADRIGIGMGWCPHAPALRAAPMISVASVGTSHLAPPEGGTGGSGRIGRGISFAVESVKTLNRNKSLLWFSLLTGLVTAVVFSLQYCIGLLATYPYNAIDFPRWLVLTFGIALFAIFSCNVLVAGLLMSLSHGEGRAIPFFKGLSRVRSCLRPLADWSVILALACTAIFAMLPHLGFSRYSLYPVAQIFPFRFILLPEVYHIGPIGGTFAMLYALASSIGMAIVILVLTLTTVFVIPLLVLENRNLPDAVAGSFTLIKNVLAETLTIVLTIGTVLCAVSLLSLLFGTVYSILAPEMQLVWYPGNEWIAAAVLFMLALCTLAFIGSTIAGIAILNLYRYAKTGGVPGPVESGHGAVPG